MMVKKSKAELINERAIKHGLLFIERNATIRSVAQETKNNKSTIHLDLHRLESIHPDLYKLVQEKLEFNSSVKHIRGGENTRKMWEKRKKNAN
jgi:putative DeoR family transcriptional regulator (stage III sporulation protein D)